MDQLVQQLKTITQTLVIEHKVSHERIKDYVFTALKELSDELPEVKVLYNKAYGGYGYSSQFERHFPNLKQDLSALTLKQERIKHVAYVEQFGKQCKKE